MIRIKVKKIIRLTTYLTIFCITFLNSCDVSIAQLVTEDDYYEIVTVPSPADIALEVSGMHLQPSGDLVLTTRFGEVWLVEDPYMEGPARPEFKRLASGLHTPLGITEKNGKFYIAQRSELTELSDTDNDGKLDEFKTFCTFDMSGNYCEYVHGPILLPDGSFWVNMNLADNGWFTREPFYGEMGHHAPWKGWAMRITAEGQMEPIASGLRSPPGMGIGKDGTLYYSENQGGWVGTGYVSTVEEGDFFGHPSSLKSANLPQSNINLHPQDIPEQDSLMFHEAVEMLPDLKMPTVRLPHGVMGTSLSWILEDTTDGSFGPFEGQLFVADQGQSKIMRMFLEEVNGEKQGAAFQFREGFESGIIRSTWGIDGSMFVGMSDRGWNALGTAPDGLQRLVWTGKIPFEMKAIRATPDGFELEFTKPVDPITARVAESYQLSSFDYLYRKEYGSPLIDQKTNPLEGIIISEDNKRVQLVFEDELRAGYIYQIMANGVQSAEGESVLHPEAFYSLNQVPLGQKTSLLDDQRLSRIPEEIQPQKEQEEATTTNLNKNQTTLPEEWKESGVNKVITVGTRPGLLFDIEQFEVQAGSKVKLVFTNSDDMLHNLVITPPGQATPVGKMALEMGINGPKNDFVPSTDQVLFYTSLIEPGTTETIFFQVPSEPGEYQFVCTYPGHYITMRGIMKVVE